MKNKILLFLVIFSVANIFTFPAFTVTHNLDSYCTVYNGYTSTAYTFLQSGRLFTALFYMFFDFINLPMDSLGFISALFSNIFLTLAIIKIYNVIKTNIKLENKIYKALLLISTFLLFYNPFMIELYMVDETFVLSLGILFVTMGAYYINKLGLKNILLSILFVVLGIICYQGILGYLFILVILFASTNIINSDKKDIITFFKKLGFSILAYLISFAVMYLILKIVLLVTGEVTTKLGHIDLIANISHIFVNLIPEVFLNFFGFINKNIYLLFCGTILLILVFLIIKNNYKKTNIMLTVLLLLAAVFGPFIPNIVMSTDSNYTAARMALTIMTIPSILMILIIIRLKFDSKYFVYGLLIIMLIIFAVFARAFIVNTKIDLSRYKNDTKYLNEIYAALNYYQIENDVKIKTVYWAKDTDVAYYYPGGYANGANIRVVAVDWACECAFNVFSNNKYEYKKMSQKKYNEYFKDKNYDGFDENAIVYEGNKAYVLLY